MTGKRIANVLKKEWRLMVSSPSSVLFGILVPLLLVGQAIFLAWILPRFLAPGALGVPALGEHGLSEADGFRVLILSQFRFFVLLIPAMVANVFATLSIVEEKITRTLEPLLATPVRTWELLAGKILAGAVPALVVAWGSAGLFVLIAHVLGWGSLLRDVITDTWYLSLFLLTPAVSLLSFVLGVIGSSRASDAKGAQNLAVVIVFPIFALIAVQVTGLVWFTPLLTVLLAVGIGVADAVLVRVAVHLFGRESIVVRWR
jgi:ABC-2 type transport system permease protein